MGFSMGEGEVLEALETFPDDVEEEEVLTEARYQW